MPEEIISILLSRNNQNNDKLHTKDYSKRPRLRVVWGYCEQSSKAQNKSGSSHAGEP